MRKHLSFPGILQLSLGLLLLFGTGVAKASPVNGFALYVGPIHSDYSGENFHSNGISVTADAQMAVNDSWSLDPYLQLSYENTNTTYHLIHGTAGLQVRYWIAQWFVGGQYLFHDEYYRWSGNTTSAKYGPAFGAAVGWQGDNHWTVMFELNSFENQGFTFSSNDRRTDVQLQIGYRW